MGTPKPTPTGNVRLVLTSLAASPAAKCKMPFYVVEVEILVITEPLSGRYDLQWRPMRPIDLASPLVRENPVIASHLSSEVKR